MSSDLTTSTTSSNDQQPKSPKRWSVASVATLFGGSTITTKTNKDPSGASPRSRTSSSGEGVGSTKEESTNTTAKDVKPPTSTSSSTKSSSKVGLATTMPSPIATHPSPTPSSLNKLVESTKFDKEPSDERLTRVSSSRHKSSSGTTKNSSKPSSSRSTSLTATKVIHEDHSSSAEEALEKLDSYLDERKASTSSARASSSKGSRTDDAMIRKYSGSAASVDGGSTPKKRSSSGSIGSGDKNSPEEPRIARSSSDRSERARLKASLLGTFLTSEPSATATGSSSSDHLETRSVYTSMTKARKLKKKEKKEDPSSLPTVKEELLSFLSTLPKTIVKEEKKKDPSSSSAAVVGSESPDRGRRRKIGAMAEVVEKRNRSRSRRARSKSRARSSKEEGGGSGDLLRRSKHEGSKDEMRRSRREDKKDDVKKSRKDDKKEKEELKSSLRKSMRPESDGKRISKTESSRKLAKAESSRKLSKSGSSRNLEYVPELQSSHGSLPSVEISPHSAISPRPSRTSRRRSNETEPQHHHHHHSSRRGTEGPSPRRKSEVPSRRKSEVSSTSSRRTHKSERRKSSAPSTVPEGDESPPSTPRKMNRHEELISPTASRAKRSSSRVRSSSRSRSSAGPAEMVIVTRTSTSKKTTGRSKSVDPRRSHRERRESQPSGDAVAARGRARAAEPEAEEAAKTAKSSDRGTSRNRARSVSPVAAKDRYSALLKSDEGAVRPRSHFTEIEASEKIEHSPGTLAKATASVSQTSKSLVVPLPESPSKKSVSDKDSIPSTPSRRLSVEEQSKPVTSSIAPTFSTSQDEAPVEYDEDDVFTFYSWSVNRQDPKKIQKERMILRQSIRETPLYRAFQHIHAT